MSCEHEFVGTGWSLSPQNGLLVCKHCSLTPNEIDLEAKLAASEKDNEQDKMLLERLSKYAKVAVITIQNLERGLNQAEAQIQRMSVCGNCKHLNPWYNDCKDGNATGPDERKCDKWE